MSTSFHRQPRPSYTNTVETDFYTKIDYSNYKAKVITEPKEIHEVKIHSQSKLNDCLCMVANGIGNMDSIITAAKLGLI